MNTIIFPANNLELSSLRSQLIGMMECWNIGMLGLEDWENGVLTNNCMKCYYSIIPLFHYSWLE